MYGILVMNMAVPGLDRLVMRFSTFGEDQRWRSQPVVTGSTGLAEVPQPTPGPKVEGSTGDAPAVASFYREAEEGGLPRVEVPSTAHLPGMLPHEAGAAGGRYPALQKVCSNGINWLQNELHRSGLGGCGGAFYPVAAKWEAVRAEAGPRVLVANGSEGEPGTFKDRYLMQHHPELLVEGIAIAARALDATEVHIVIDPDCTTSQRAMHDAVTAFGRSPDGPGNDDRAAQGARSLCLW